MNATATAETTSQIHRLAIGYARTIRGFLVWRTSSTHYAVGETLLIGDGQKLYTADEAVNFIIANDK